MRAGPPRGMARSMRSSSWSSAKVASRSGVGTTCAAARGSPAAESPSAKADPSASAERSASEPGRRIAALPLFTQSAAASTVTFGRASYTISTTPSGMRTFLTRRPFGRRQLVVTSPTGSGRDATSPSARAMPSSRAASSASRSRKAAFWPAFFAAATSALLAARIVRERFASASAAARSASSFCSVEARESSRAASRAAPARVRISSGRVVGAGCRISGPLRLLPACLEQDQVVPVDDLVEVLIPERALDLARLEAGDAADLVGAVAGEPAREGAPRVDGDVDRVPHPELPGDAAHAGGEEAAALGRERPLRAGVHQDEPLPARGRSEPALAAREALRLGREVGADARAGEELRQRARAAAGEERRPDPLR